MVQLGKWFGKYKKDLADPNSGYAKEIKNPTSFVQYKYNPNKFKKDPNFVKNNSDFRAFDK